MDRPYNPAWSARRWIASARRRQQTLDLVHHIDRELPRVPAGTVEHQVRAGLESLNNLIEGLTPCSRTGMPFLCWTLRP